MYDLLIMIFCCTVFAYIIETRTYRYPSVHVGKKYDNISKVLYIVIFIWISLFAALRSAYNDTGTYMESFSFLEVSSISFGEIFLPYGGFDVFQKIIKRYISSNPQALIFISSLLICYLYIPFIAKHTKNYAGAVFLFLISNYIFGMAGIKQAIAMGLALYAIDKFMKHKYIGALIILFIAYTFHPYIICLFSIMFLKRRIWDRRTIFMIAIFILLFLNLDKVFGILSVLGKDYSMESFSDYTINPFRVLVESVPVIISFIYRNELNREDDKWLILGINMQVISFTFIALGLFFNPIYLGRMSTYFTILSAISIPKMLRVVLRNFSDKKLLTFLYYCFFAIYFLMDLSKVGSVSLSYDQFKHISLWSIF